METTNAKNKLCSKCKSPKGLNEFALDSTRKDGLSYVCKGCTSGRNKHWYSKNAENKNAQGKQWRENNPERMKFLVRRWTKKNIERERTRLRKVAKKIRSTTKGKLNNSMASNVSRSLNGSKSRRPWVTLVGYTVEQLKRHLEKQFLPGMSWENRSDWDIDHKIPLAAFNFERPEDPDFQRAWALKNLRPLWKADNRRKGATVSAPFQPSLTL